jgi:hypothetical protein
MIIGAKYATYGTSKIEQFRSRKIPNSERKYDHMLGAWAKQEDLVVMREMNRSMAQNDIEDSNMYFAFMRRPKEKTRKRLEDTEVKMAKYVKWLICKHYKKKRVDEMRGKLEVMNAKLEWDEDGERLKIEPVKVNSLKICGEDSVTFLEFYRAQTVLFYLIKLAYRKQKSFRNLALYSTWAMGVFRGYLPSVFFGDKITLLPGDSIFEKSALFLVNFSLILGFSYTARFFFQSAIDFGRKITLMDNLSNLISSDRTTKTKYLPNLNVLDPNSLITWRKARTVIRVYGQKMTLRQEIFMPVMMFWMIGMILFIYLNHFGAFSVSKTVQDTLLPLMYIDFVVFTVMILTLLYTVARVNRFFRLHIKKLEKLKLLIKEMNTYKAHYFGVEEDKVPILAIQKEVIYEDKLKNRVIKAYCKKLLEICPRGQIGGYLDMVYGHICDLVNELERERIYDSITVIKVPVTMEFFMSMMIGCLVSGLGALKFLFLS